MWRSIAAITPIDGDADFATTAGIYRARLQRHQHALQTMWLWYLLPLTLGPALISGAAAQVASRPHMAMIGTVILLGVIWLSVTLPARQHARNMQARISALQRAEEQR
jgi:hypothetical protein